MKYKFGFIGCGNMGSALVAAVAKTIDGNEIAICDHNEYKTDKLASEYGVVVEKAAILSKESQYLVVGVKPQAVEKTAKELSGINKETVIISMLAGVNTERLQNLFGTKKVIRIMPNLPCKIGQGVILYTLSEEIGKEEETEFLQAFEKSGELVKISENNIDAASAISGCGPAFVSIFIESLADGGVKCGLTRETAIMLACQTLIGTAALIKQGEHPEMLKDSVCSPGGTTIEGVTALENRGFRSAAIEAVMKSYEKNAKL